MKNNRDTWVCAEHTHDDLLHCKTCYGRELISSNLAKDELRVILAARKPTLCSDIINAETEHGPHVMYKCGQCSFNYHVNCKVFFLACEECFISQKVCTHGDKAEPICESCCMNRRKTCCAQCGDGTELVPFADSGFVCVFCHSTFHTKCMDRVSAIKGQFYCQKCASDSKEPEDKGEDNCSRKEKRMAMARDLDARKNLYVDEIAMEFVNGTMTIEDLQRETEQHLFYRIYCPWSSYFRRAVHEITALRSAGYQTGSRPSDEDVKFSLDMHLDQVENLNRKPWEQKMSVQDWRKFAGL